MKKLKADLKLIVIEPKSVEFSHFLEDLASKKAILVVNKIDLGLSQLSDELKKYNPVFISIKDEKNLDKLVSLIKANLKNKFISSGDIFITRERHRLILKNV